MLPEVRSVGGAAWVFTFALYPYVYLLARTALSERAAHTDGGRAAAGRAAGAAHPHRGLPLARPAVAAGVALALMETLADFGVSSYFGIQTFTAGIYKAWLAMDNRIAAAQLATMLLVLVAVLLQLEHRAQRRMRFAAGRGARAGTTEAQPVRLRGVRAGWPGAGVRCRCWLGFVLPVLFMLRPLAADWDVLPWDRFVQWSFNSLRLGCHHRRAGGGRWRWRWPLPAPRPDPLTRGVVQLAGAGLCRAGRGDRGGPAAAGGLAAGRPRRSPGVATGSRPRCWAGVGLPGAVLRGGAAVGAKRLFAHPAQL
jgi:iron(III) transport system permease protein